MLLDRRSTADGSEASDNGVLYTAEYLQLLKWNGVLKGDLRERYKREIITMIDRLRVVQGVAVVPGVFNRYPGYDAHAFSQYFSQDEQQGLLTLDAVFDYELGYARELNEYGKTHLYCYDNIQYSPYGYPPVCGPVDLTKYHIPVTIPADIASVFASAILPARQPQFIELVRLAAGEEPVLFNEEWFVWSLRVSTLLPEVDTSSKILIYHALPIMYQAVRDSHLSPLMKLRSLKAMADWYDRMALMYLSDQHPLHEIYKGYYQDENDLHPIRRLSKYLKCENARLPAGRYKLGCTATCDNNCTSSCDCDCSAQCTKKVLGVSVIDPVCEAKCELDKATCEGDCVVGEKECEALCALIEEALNL